MCLLFYDVFNKFDKISENPKFITRSVYHYFERSIKKEIFLLSMFHLF